MPVETYLAHHGIKGQRWGVRRFQNPDGSLTPRGQKHYQKLDDKWVDKKSDKVYAKAFKQSTKEMNKYSKKLAKQYDVRGRSYMNEYNKKLAEVMSTKTSNLRSPSGKVVKFVAKRGELGVYMALADESYNMNKVKNGVWADGRVGYKKDSVNMTQKR